MGSESPAAYISPLFTIFTIFSAPFLQFTFYINFLRLPAIKAFLLSATPLIKET